MPVRLVGLSLIFCGPLIARAACLRVANLANAPLLKEPSGNSNHEHRHNGRCVPHVAKHIDWRRTTVVVAATIVLGGHTVVALVARRIVGREGAHHGCVRVRTCVCAVCVCRVCVPCVCAVCVRFVFVGAVDDEIVRKLAFRGLELQEKPSSRVTN